MIETTQAAAQSCPGGVAGEAGLGHGAGQNGSRQNGSRQSGAGQNGAVQNGAVLPSVRSRGSIARSMVAWLGLVALLVLVPGLLVLLGRLLPVDVSLIGIGIMRQPDDGGVLLLVLLGMAWAAWATLAASVAVEGWAALRSVPTPAIPGLAVPQRIAAGLVAALAMGGGTGLGAGLAVGLNAAPAGVASPAVRVAMDTSGEVGPQQLALASLVRVQDGADGGSIERATSSGGALDVGSPTNPESTPPSAGPRVGAGADTDGSDAGPPPIERGGAVAAALESITTRRHDTLWLLAEQHLGDGARFTEIVALNEGLPQPDGRALGPDGRIYPGWTLQLPADADVRAPRPERHRVTSGDTLWEIADEHLGDPHRYPEVFEANAGDLQPDGRRLTDPDRIHPGWVLAMPGDADSDVDGSSVRSEGAENSDPGTHASSDPGAPDDTAREDAAPEVAGPVEEDAPVLDRGSTATGPGSAAATEREAPLLERGADNGAEVPDVAGSEAAEPGSQAATPEAGILLPAGGTIATLLLAGVARELVRRRRLFQRHRRPGERMPAPGSGAREWEVAARAAAGDPGPDLLERALADLARSAQASGTPLPRVRTVRVTPSSVTLDLARDAERPGALPPFIPDGVARWELDRGLLSAPVGGGEWDEHADERPFPGLVTVGVRGEETVLVDLGEVGTLSVTGAPEAVPGVLRALVSEVALGPAHGRVATTLCLSDLALSEAVQSALEAGDLAVDSDATRVSGLIAAVLERPTPASGADPLEVIIADTPLSIAVPGRAGAALVTTHPTAGAGVRLELDGSGGGLLLPDGIRVAPQTLAASAVAHLATLLAATHVPADPVIDLREPSSRTAERRDLAERPAEPTAEGPAEPAVERPAEQPAEPAVERPAEQPAERKAPSHGSAWGASSAPVPVEGATEVQVPDTPVAADGPGRAAEDPGAASGAPRILLLGEVLVEGATGRAESTRIGRLAETAAFVLLNPGARPSELQSALWPGRRSNPQTCRQMISRTRTWLGRTDDGEPYLMPFADTGGRLRLRPDVTSDWDEFQRLAQAGLADPQDTDDLTAALNLVRGRPFGPVAAREIPWADLALNDMLCLITDVAHELAVRHERAGRPRAAREAALRGLRTETEAEVLTAIVARTGPV